MEQLQQLSMLGGTAQEEEQKTAATELTTVVQPAQEGRSLDEVYLTKPVHLNAIGVAYITSRAEQQASTLVPKPIVLPAAPLSRYHTTLNSLQALFDLAATDSTRECIEQLIHLHGRIGIPSSSGGAYTVFVKATTPNAIRDIKALICQADVSPEIQRVFEAYKPFLASIKWRFGDVFDAFDFLSAYGRDDIFATQGESMIQIALEMSCQSCCSLLNKDSRLCCDGDVAGCLICAAPLDRLPSDLIPGISLFDLNDPGALNRSACPHTQSYRFLSFLAARTMKLGFDPSSADGVTRLRKSCVLNWYQKQKSWEWTFPEGEFPPRERAPPVTVDCDDGSKVRYVMNMSKDAFTGERKFYFGFVGPFERMM